MPTWSLLCGFAIPIWPLIILVLVGRPILWVINRIRYSINNRRRGFPVLLSNDNPHPG